MKTPSIIILSIATTALLLGSCQSQGAKNVENAADSTETTAKDTSTQKKECVNETNVRKISTRREFKANFDNGAPSKGDLTITNSYYNDGREMEIVDRKGRYVHKTVFSYDKDNRLTAKNEYLDDNFFQKTTYSYKDGNVVRETTTQEGNVVAADVTYTYDTDNHLTAKTKKEDGITEKTSYSYNDAGLVVEESTGMAKHTYTYDEKGRKIKETATFTDQAGYSYTYKYNPKGQLVEEEVLNGDDELEKKTDYTYNGNGQLVEEKVSDADNKIITKTTYQHNENGDVSYKETIKGDDKKGWFYTYEY